MIDNIATAHDAQWSPSERQRLVRLCLHSFGPSDTSRRACPYDVVTSLRRALTEVQTPTPAAVERAAATLPSERFRPDLTPTATKLYATLLKADQPLGRSALIDRAGISASSYDRRLSAVHALECVSAVHVDGHRRWIVDDASTRATAWVPPATVPSNRRHTSAPLVMPRHQNTPVRNSTSTTVRSGCSHNDTANWWQIQVRIATATALDGDTAHHTPLPMEPDSQQIVWSARIPGQQPGQRTYRHVESPATEFSRPRQHRSRSHVRRLAVGTDDRILPAIKRMVTQTVRRCQVCQLGVLSERRVVLMPGEVVGFEAITRIQTRLRGFHLRFMLSENVPRSNENR